MIGPIVVLGAGSWGTALTRLLAQKGFEMWLWVRRKELAEKLLMLIQGPSQWRKLSQNARKTAEKYDIRRIAEKYLQLAQKT